MTRTLLQLIRRKKRAFRNWATGKNGHTYNTYMTLNKKVKQEIQKAKSNYINGHLEQELSKGNSRPLYKYIHSKAANNSKLAGLEVNGILTQDNVAMANSFQTAFQTVFTYDSGILPQTVNINPDATNIEVSLEGVKNYSNA